MTTKTPSPEERAKQINDDLKAAEAARAAEQARADAEAAKSEATHGEKLDKLLSCLDGLTSRVDGFSKRMDAFEAKQRKDAEMNHAGMDRKAEGEGNFGKVSDEGEHGERPSEDPDERELLETKERREGEARPVVADSQSTRDMLRAAMAHAQARCDRVASAFSTDAPRPLDGEGLRAYRCRLLATYIHNSPDYKDVPDEVWQKLPTSMFNAMENRVYADSLAAAASPHVPEGELFARKHRDQSGREITTWYGQPKVWMQQFSCVPRRVVGIRNHNRD